MTIPYLHRRREKVFGPGRAVPLDGNAKARIQAYAEARSAQLVFRHPSVTPLWDFRYHTDISLLSRVRIDRRSAFKTDPL